MINIQKVNQFLITIYYLKLSQILWRIYYFIKPRYLNSIPKNCEINLLKPKTKWLKKSNSILDKNKFIFLNKTNHIRTDLSLEKQDFNKLWLYNLNYFDYLNSELSKVNQNFSIEFIDRWIREIKTPQYFGYDPYPTSLRIVNWIKFYLVKGHIKDNVKSSLFIQTELLFYNLEWHLLGNHILANAKALIYSGLFFQGKTSKKWKSTGIQIYKKQIKAQILPDGGHFEKSPMYHSIILEDILDLINISSNNHHLLPKDFVNELVSTAEKMLSWLRVMSYKNGETPHFNDSTKNISHNIKTLTKYAKSLNIKTLGLYNIDNKISVRHLRSSGFLRIDQTNATSFLDVGSIGASYIPGHAHADTLSFETSFFNQRFFVNIGISTYEKSDRRYLERSTKSHNTVEVDKRNSSDIWSSFRVAARAKIVHLQTNKNKNKSIISCSHNGYNTIIKKNYHNRKWIFQQNKIIIMDNITLIDSSAIAHFILHPNIDVIKNKTNKNYTLINNNKRVNFTVESGKEEIVKKLYASEFGVLSYTKCIAIKLHKGKSKISLSW